MRKQCIFRYQNFVDTALQNSLLHEPDEKQTKRNSIQKRIQSSEQHIDHLCVHVAENEVIWIILCPPVVSVP